MGKVIEMPARLAETAGIEWERARKAAEIERRRRVIDEYGEVKRRLALTDPDQERASLLKAEIEGWFSEGDGATPIAVRGELYEIQMSARRNERTVTDKRKAFNLLKKTLGIDGLIAVIDIPFGKAIDKNIPDSLQKSFISQERSGYRTFNVVALAPAAGKQAA